MGLVAKSITDVWLFSLRVAARYGPIARIGISDARHHSARVTGNSEVIHKTENQLGSDDS